MANLTQTAANVTTGAVGMRVECVEGGEAVTQGMPVYRNTTNRKWYQCDANASSTTAAAEGIAVTPCGGDGSSFVVAKPGSGGKMNVGATLTVGTTYVVSATKGAICPIADLTTGDYVTILGTASTTALLDFTQITVTGVAKP